MFSLPARTTHRLRPMNKSVFKSLKINNNEASSICLRTNPGSHNKADYRFKIKGYCIHKISSYGYCIERF